MAQTQATPSPLRYFLNPKRGVFTAVTSKELELSPSQYEAINMRIGACYNCLYCEAWPNSFRCLQRESPLNAAVELPQPASLIIGCHLWTRNARA